MRKVLLPTLICLFCLAIPAKADRLQSAVALCMDPEKDFQSVTSALVGLGYEPADERDVWLVAEFDTLLLVVSFRGDWFPTPDEIAGARDAVLYRIDNTPFAAFRDRDGTVVTVSSGITTGEHNQGCGFVFRKQPTEGPAPFFASGTMPESQTIGYYKVAEREVTMGDAAELRVFATIDTDALDAALPGRPGLAAFAIVNVKVPKSGE